MLDVIAEGVFDPQLTATIILKGAGVRDNSLPSQFHRALGLPPRAYLEECRLETAARLLVRAEGLKIGEIGELVGFTSVQSFSQAFERWACERPNRYRERFARLRKAGSPSPDPGLLRSSWWQRIEEDDLGSGEAEMLIQLIEETYNLESVKPKTSETSADLQARESRAAEAVWSRVRGLSREGATKELRGWAACFRTPALVRHLLEAARLEGRRDRQQGVWIGEAAIHASIALSASLSTAQMTSLMIEALASLANQRRRAADFEAARQGFSEITEITAVLSVPEHVEAKVLYLESHLARDEGDLEKALSLAERSFRLAERGRRAETMVHALLARGMAHWGLHDLTAAIASLRSASELVDDCEDEYLALAIEQHLARVSAVSGRTSLARASMDKAQALARDLGLSHQACPHLDWVEGLILSLEGRYDRAEELLLRARQSFLSAGDKAHMAIVSLELALVLEEQGRFEDLCSLMIETIPTLESLRLDDEGRAALVLIQRALGNQRIHREMLSKLRDQLYRQVLSSNTAAIPSDRSDHSIRCSS